MRKKGKKRVQFVRFIRNKTKSHLTIRQLEGVVELSSPLVHMLCSEFRNIYVGHTAVIGIVRPSKNQTSGINFKREENN